MILKQDIKLSIVIVTYNSQKYIFNCLESINKFNDLGNKLEVIIIDNKSSDDAVFMNSKINYDFNTTVLYSGNNLGFGGGNNLGVDLAKGEIVCLLNADTVLFENIFKECCAKFKNRHIRTLGVKLVDENLKSQISYFFIRGYFSSLNFIVVYLFNIFEIKLSNMITSGACMFVRYDDFKTIGGFNSKMFLYHEESFLARKFSNYFDKNIFYFEKSLKLIHLEKSESPSKMLLSEYYKSMVFYYKYFNFNKYFILKIFYFKLILRNLFFKSNNPKIDDEYKQIKFHFNKKI